MRIYILKIIYCIFGIIVNVCENLIDLAILIGHFHNKNNIYFILSILFYFLPNIIILFCSTFHFISSRNIGKHSCLSSLLIILNLDVILPNLILMSYESHKKTNNKNPILDLLDIKFILLISHCFHTLFNNYPFSMVQFNYMVTCSNISRKHGILIIVKILISITKINFYSVKIVFHFLKNEFGLCVPKIFPIVRFMTNFLFFTSKAFVYSISFLFAPKTVIIFLIAKYILSICINFKFIGISNSLEGFWSFFWAVCDQICFVQDFYFNSKFNSIGLLISFVEFLSLSMLSLFYEFKNLELAYPKFFLVLIVVSFLLSYCLELCYWCLNPIWTGNRRNESIFLNCLKQWLKSQSDHTNNEWLINSEDSQQIYLISE